MIHIDILKSRRTKNKPLSANILDALINTYSYPLDLDQRLWHLPVITRGKNIGSFPRTNVNEYATKVAQEQGLDLYIGYFVYLHTQTRKWQMHEHTFTVNPANGRVYEHARDMNWDNICYYIGMLVPKSDYKDEVFVERFNHLSYIKEHSSRGLIPLTKKKVEHEKSR